MVGRIFAFIVGFILVFVLSAFGVSLVLAPSATSNGEPGTAMMISVIFSVALAAVLAYAGKTVGKAWRYIFIACALMSFAMPICGIVFTGGAMQATGGNAASQAGAALGGSIVTAGIGFVAVFVGVIFLILGLLTGRDKQVLYVREGSPNQNS